MLALYSRIELCVRPNSDKMVKPGTEELRQNVFSSIHMSTMVKSTQTSITYPSCTFCGGSLSSKGSPKRKVLFCQLTLYTNPSESFIVWFKKQEEPKGLLWLRSCCVRKEQANTIELISRGCRGRCSYTLKFAAPSVTDEWYRMLKQESRRMPTVGDELSSDVECDSAPLDSILAEMTPPLVQVYSENDEDGEAEPTDTLTPITVTPTTSKSKPLKTVKPKHKVKSTRVFCNPLQGLTFGHRKISLPANSSYASTTAIVPLESIENTTDDQVSRWSWPLKA